MLGRAAVQRVAWKIGPLADAETTPKSEIIEFSSPGVFWVTMTPCPASSHCAVGCSGF